MQELTELWILQSSGTCIFHHTKENKVDPYLFAGFFTAINQIGQHYSKSNIDGIIMSNYLLMSDFDDEYGLTFVARCKNTNKRKALKKTILHLKDQFKNVYNKEEVANWNGNLNHFEKFGEVMHLYFHDAADLTESLKSIF
jgi:hypothetical protein